MMNNIDSLSHGSKLKSNEDKMGVQREIKIIYLAWSKILLVDLMDVMVMIPFNYCLGDDTCLIDLIANWI
jgi:hypothetical protein